ncbi:MAG: right-handed parallel beta-helix repeat-containing protein [Verrucomicrobiota bacterium]|jgi:hypothetical protein|nr:right-handed parallel beta-helix repeat-containing protein [Verrucomicrobiota bacterium]
MKSILLCCSSALLLLTGCATPMHTVFVAPDGSDANPGSKAAPFATLPRAMAAVRDARSGDLPPAPATVYLRGGTYALREPLVFTPADSGTAAAPVTIAAYPGEKPVLSGGERLTGAWTRTTGKPFWQLDVPRARDGGWVFHALFVNGQSRERARTPNWGEKVFRADGREPGGDPRQALRYFAGDVDPAWSNPTDIDVVLLCSWTPTIHRIQEIVPERRAVRFFSSHTRPVDFWERNFRYYLSNVFEALDQPGEWYLNRHTGTLYYYPLPGEDLAAAEVIAPVVRSRLVSFESAPAEGRTIEHLHFRGLAFRHIDGDMDKHNGAYRQGHMYLTAAVAAKGLRHASFERCEFSQLGEYALELADGCRDVAVRQCHFWDIGAGALQLGVTDLPTLRSGEKLQRPEDPNPLRVDGLTIDNNLIHRLGTIWHGCYGIVNRFASNTRITHNDISDIHWNAIGLDARWDWKGEDYSHGNVVAYNHLHDLGLRYHTDTAGIYQFGPLDTHIHHNRIHDTAAYGGNCGYAGIYLDEQSRGAVVENNLVYNVDWYAYFQHKGTDNLFRNNIGASARDGFIGRGGLNEQWKENYLEASRNVYAATNAVAIADGWQDGTRPPLLTNNLYFSAVTNAPATAGKDPGAQTARLPPGARVSGPLGPADFNAIEAEAVRRIGFTPILAETAKAGLTGDAAWRALPARQSPRAPSAVWEAKDLKRLNAFESNFNLLKPGDAPDVFQMSAEPGAGFAVTREVAGVSGPQCLKCTDKKGLSKSFNPYMHAAPRGLDTGRVTFSFAARLPEQGAAPFSVECRGKGGTRETGPSLAFAADGGVKANGRPVGTLAPGAWTTFEIAFTFGATPSQGYTLSVAGGPRIALPYASASFTQLSWLGITAPADIDGCFYLDALKLAIEE